MNIEAEMRGRPLKGFFGLLSLIILFIYAEAIYGQWNAPVPEFSLDSAGTATVKNVISGSSAEAAGLQAGDVIQKIDGVLFDWSSLATFASHYRPGNTIQLSVSRSGQLINLSVPLVSAGSLYLARMILFAVGILLGGALAFILLWRFFRKTEVQILFLMMQTAAAGFLLPAIMATDWVFLPLWQLDVAGAAASLSILIAFYSMMTYPVKIGSPGRRRAAGVILFALGLAMEVVWLLDIRGWGSLIGKFVIAALLVMIFVATILLFVYVYLKRATHLQRRQLRLVSLGFLFSLGPTIFLYSLPRIFFGNPFVNELVAVGCFLIGLLFYVYVILYQNLTRVDQVLNRAVVTLVLFAGILIILLIPVIILERILPNDWIIQAFILAGLTLLVALSFTFVRQWVQRRVDIFFYGGWYDYPKVIETISTALAHSLKWEQLEKILTRQVPELMKLTNAWLILDHSSADARFPAAEPQIRIPLQFEDKPYATWVVGPRQDNDYFSTSDRNILTTLTPQIEVALSNILHVERLREQLAEIRASQETMVKMEHQLIRSRDQEQERLSRELHDGPLQELVGMNMQLGMLVSKSHPEQAQTPFGDALSALQLEVRSLMAELREVCAGLRPPMLDTLGLCAALRALVDRWAGEEQVPIALELPPDDSVSFLPAEVSLNLYRVVQEALANIARHAGASQVTIRLASDTRQEILSLAIEDDGQGFVPEEVNLLAGQNHFGLAGMQERVKLIGGFWTLSSAPGSGTRIQVTWQQKDWQNSQHYHAANLVSGQE